MCPRARSLLPSKHRQPQSPARSSRGSHRRTALSTTSTASCTERPTTRRRGRCPRDRNAETERSAARRVASHRAWPSRLEDDLHVEDAAHGGMSGNQEVVHHLVTITVPAQHLRHCANQSMHTPSPRATVRGGRLDRIAIATKPNARTNRLCTSPPSSSARPGSLGGVEALGGLVPIHG